MFSAYIGENLNTCTRRAPLATPDALALFVWRKFSSLGNQEGVNCAVFRNEGPVKSSDLIRAADAIARERKWSRIDSNSMALGKKTGGRKPGSLNRRTKLKEQLTHGLPIEKGVAFAELVLDGKVPCGVCHGKGKTKYQPRRKKVDGLWVDGVSDMPEEDVKLGERTCQSCYGSGLERLSPGERLRAALELIEYGYGKKKSVEVSNPDGTLRPSWEVVILEAKDGKN